jgi:hypothetical protein
MPPVKRFIRTLVPAIALLAMLVVPAQAGPGFRELGEYGVGFANQHWGPGCAKAANPGKSKCQVIAQVTGYQVKLAGHNYPFSVNHRGKIVAFTLKIGAPPKKYLNDFITRFGQPSVRLAVLKPPPPGHGVKRHKVLTLVRQSGVYNLRNYVGKKGRTVSFALSKALVMPAGSTLALTIPTWAPVFAAAAQADNKAGRRYQWRGSRRKGACGGSGLNDAHQTVGKFAYYDCLFKGPQLEYTATFLRDPPPSK